MTAFAAVAVAIVAAILLARSHRAAHRGAGAPGQGGRPRGAHAGQGAGRPRARRVRARVQPSHRGPGGRCASGSQVTERIAARQEIGRYVAHEIKNPLAPIRAAVETLRRLRARDDPAFDEYFDEATRTVLDEVHRITNIVSAFAEFARLPAPNPAPVDLVEVVKGLVALHTAGGAQVVFEGRVRRYADLCTPIAISSCRSSPTSSKTASTRPVANALVTVRSSRRAVDDIAIRRERQWPRCQRGHAAAALRALRDHEAARDRARTRRSSRGSSRNTAGRLRTKPRVPPALPSGSSFRSGVRPERFSPRWTRAPLPSSGVKSLRVGAGGSYARPEMVLSPVISRLLVLCRSHW